MPLDEKQLAEALRTEVAVDDCGCGVLLELKQFSNGIFAGLDRSNAVRVRSPNELSPYVESEPVIERWVNVYPKSMGDTRLSKGNSDANSGGGRIGLIHITYNPDEPFGQRVTVEEIALEESK